MTAEIAVLNRHAVALAADSAITTGGPGQEKVFNTSNKLFAFSREHPIGVMIWGYVSHSGVPIETIVKEARASLGKTGLSHVNDYATFFFDFLKHHKLAGHDHDLNSVGLHVYSALAGIATACHAKSNGGKLSLTKIIQRQCEAALIRMEEAPACPVCGGMSCRRFRILYKDSVDAAIMHAFSANISKVARTALHRVAHGAITNFINTQFTTGIVFAGFGEDEWFPSLSSFVLNGTVDGEVRVKMDAERDLDRYNNTASVMAFAQKSMVHRFMDGIDPLYRQWLLVYFREQMLAVAQEIIKEHASLKEDERRVVSKIIIQQLGKVIADMDKTAQARHRRLFTDPILQVVQRSPKEALAEIAEALVSLSALERRMNVEQETVGGPIDVALISKGDGFIWIKRKHYFDIALNRQFWYRQLHSDGSMSNAKG
jgi:hypothetical protein